MSTTTECAREGCTVRGQHLDTCTGYTDRGEVCRGCVPRRAEHGLLCSWDWQRLNSDVATAPALVRHLRLLAVPHAGAAPPSDGRGYNDPSEGSILSGAVDAADEVHALLASWAAIYVEDHPGSQGPDERHVWRTRQTLRGNEHGQYVKRSTVVGIRHEDGTADLVRWLLPQLEWLSRRQWAGEARAELGDLLGRTRARFPMEERGTRPIPGTPCPYCDRRSLTFTPPSVFRTPFVVACTHPDCGTVFSEDQWERIVALSTGQQPPTPDPYIRPAAPARLQRFDPATGFQGLSLIDEAVEVCPKCNLATPCECEQAVTS